MKHQYKNTRNREKNKKCDKNSYKSMPQSAILDTYTKRFVKSRERFKDINYFFSS